jgi:hypothetical protein
MTDRGNPRMPRREAWLAARGNKNNEIAAVNPGLKSLDSAIKIGFILGPLMALIAIYLMSLERIDASNIFNVAAVFLIGQGLLASLLRATARAIIIGLGKNVNL